MRSWVLHNRRFIAWFMIAAIALPALLLGQMQPPGRNPSPRRDPANRPPPLVTVTKADGSTMRGEVVSSDPDQIVFKPARRPADEADPEPINIPWTEIKRLSNGLTQQKALDTWKAQHTDQLCETCRGNRKVLCDTCKGTTHDPESAKECKSCSGELLVDCKTPKCKEGVMSCPEKCLKLTEGAWTTRPDGLKWRVFRTSRGSAEWSENHVGEVVVMENGQWVNKGKCPTCGGKTQIDCPNCRGAGKAPCATCIARKDAPACPGSCDHGRVACETCTGTGLKP